MSRRFVATTLAVMASALSLPAAAEICAQDVVCASNPEGIVAALQAAGYKALLSKSSVTGNPRIASAASGYDFDVFFYGCNNHVNCDNIMFMVVFEKDEINSSELANQWNKDNRFSTMSYDPKDGTLSINYDVTMVGGLNKTNFADDVDWWNATLGNVAKFFAAHPALDKAKANKPS